MNLSFSGWFRGRISANEDANVVVTVYHDADTTEKYTFKLNPNESGWQNLTKRICHRKCLQTN